MIINWRGSIMQSPSKHMLKKQVIKMKVCVIGDPAAGKSTLIHRLIQEDDEPEPTDDYEVSIYLLDTRTALMEIQLWDCSNLHFHYHKHLRHAFFRNSSAALLVFDLTRQDWHQTAHNWISEAYDNQCYLVYGIATKMEQIKDKERLSATKEEAEALFKKYEIILHYLYEDESIQRHFEEVFGRMHDQSIVVSRGSMARGITQLPFLVEEEEEEPTSRKELREG